MENENRIIVPDMPHMRDIFRILKSGAFINEQCFSHAQRGYYKEIKENFEAYFKYFEQLGYFLEEGKGYFHLCEERTMQATQIRARNDLKEYIPMMRLFTKWNPALEPGSQFKTAEFLHFCEDDDEAKMLLPTSDDGLLPSRLSKFLKNTADEGYIDLSSDEKTCMITSAFLYAKDYVTSIKLYGDSAKYNYSLEDEVSEPEAEEIEAAAPETEIIDFENEQA